LIKAEGKLFLNKVDGRVSSAADENAECILVSLDISIDGPEHSGTRPYSFSLTLRLSSGLATTAVTETMLHHLPGIGPVSTLLKEYLKAKVRSRSTLFFPG
jgi:hypothetical protein